ncbi:hypothetical protein CRG98_014724 [Punica granatum]|uniref:Uncharacterized protein n=1 Tax=Punica granatum TaxID=22663 RepID=A0A2I0K8L7_PUNGR|nr:hypothetical protein CRG98_014724 [Punica granatum]
MASACVNNIGMSPDNFPAPSYPTYGWLSQTRLSFTPNDDYSMSFTTTFQRQPPSPPQQQSRDTSLTSHQPPDPDPEPSGGDFEFCLEDPVAMLPADELFSNGKFVPLQVSLLKPSIRVVTSMKVSSPDLAKRHKSIDMFAMDLYSPLPKLRGVPAG